jgi:hypothetical protein
MKISMKHFTDEDWLDFAKRSLPGEKMTRMRAHLDRGCRSCGEVFLVWENVYEIVGRQADYEPDESVVNAVKDAYAERQWRLPTSTFESALAKLVFDSFVDATAIAGIRAASTSARHLVYQFPPWIIDVRVDTEGGRRMIAGQVLESAGQSATAAQGGVVLMRGDMKIAETTTNKFGEFQLECEGGSNLRILLEIGGQQPVSVNLPD